MIEEDLLVLEKDFISDEIGRIENKFEHLLRKKDKSYGDKIGFNVVYNLSSDYFKIEIFPTKKDFNSQEYFMNNFETKPGMEKLSKFAKENNVGLVTY